MQENNNFFCFGGGGPGQPINAVLALAFAEINKFAEIKKLTLTLTF